MKKLNNKGYMLVEIILASVIAFGVAYFILDLVIKLKNKNDDLFVDTLARTDQAIITNTIMRDIYNKNTQFSCNNIPKSVDDNKFKYKDTIIEVNKYTIKPSSIIFHNKFIRSIIAVTVKYALVDFLHTFWPNKIPNIKGKMKSKAIEI